MRRKIASIVALLCACYVNVVVAQEACKPPEIVFNKTAFNIFSPAQEMDLGEIVAQIIEKDFYVITDAEANRKVREIGERLSKHLPPTDIKFQFFVIDAPVVNAFNTAGGRIYVTRKLIAFVQNEDELAGIIGHELGHGVVRHVSADISKNFKEILGTDKVGDKKDIYGKYNELINKQRTKRVKRKDSHGDNQQMEADRIGLHALVAAGYNSQHYATAFDRLVEAKGKTGSAFSNFFGTTSPEQKRLREMLEVAQALPANCKDKRSGASNDDFDKWQSYVVTTSTFQKEEKLTNLVAKRSLNPHLRGEVSHIRYSPNGKYVVAQDSSGINVLTSSPFNFSFRIEAPGARPATFTPDSKNLVFQTQGYRIEKWDLEEKKPTQVKEFYKRGGCMQSAVSPDGKYVVCFTLKSAYENTLEVFNVETNETVLKKDHYYRPTLRDLFEWQLSMFTGGTIDSFAFEFSPSGRYLVTSRVARLNPSGGGGPDSQRYTWETLGPRQDMAFAYDLQEKKEVKMGGNLKDIVSLPFAFRSEDMVIGQSYTQDGKGGLFSFPGGQQKDKFVINGNSFTFPGDGPFFIVRPMPSSPVGIYELSSQKFVLANRNSALDMYGNNLVSEKKSGELAMYTVNGPDEIPKQIGSVILPKNRFGALRTIAVSPDLNWMALSERSRGGVWNLKTGERPIHIRGFSGSFIDDDSNIYADFPRYEQQPRTVTMLNPVRVTMAALDEINKPTSRQYGKFLVRMKTREETRREQGLSEGKSSQNVRTTGEVRGPDISIPGATVSTGTSTTEVDYTESTIDFSDVRTNKILWSRTFPQERPTFHVDGANETAVFYWRLTTKAAKEIIAANPQMAEKAKAMGEKEGDYLVQVFEAGTGEKLGEMLIETGEGSFRINRAFASGDWLTLIDSENRVQVYSILKGEQLWNFFGDNAAINPTRGIIAIENGAGQISIYDLNSGDKIEQLVFPSAISTLIFSRDGKTMFALTAHQDYYLFNAEGFGKK